MAIVYTHTRNDNGQVFYVGIGTRELRAYTKHSRSSWWGYIANKHGFTVNITHSDLIWEEACAIERYLIAFYGRRDLGEGTLVNLTDGGEGVENPSHRLSGIYHPMYGRQHKEDAKEKMKNYHRNRPKPSEGTLLKMSLAMSGEKNPMYGKCGELSPVFGKPKSEEHKRKLSELKKGKPNTKMSGKNNPNYGKVGGKNPAAKEVIDLITGRIYECALYAAMEFKMAATTLRNMLNGNKPNKTTLRYL